MIDLFFTRDSEAVVREALESEPAEVKHNLLAHHQLPSGEAISISSWHSSEADRTLKVNAAPHDQRDLLILPEDPDDTGRPIRLTLCSNPKDGDLLTVWEMGGYWHTPLTDAEWAAMRDPYT